GAAVRTFLTARDARLPVEAAVTAVIADETRPEQVPAEKDHCLFIGGEWVDSLSDQTFPVVNPATGETICRVAEAGPADVDRAVKAARKALESGPWGRMDAVDRGRLLFKLADLIEKNAEELARLESLNGGKSIRDSRSDMIGVVNTFRYYA